jgi:CheY-like chemotaxis protein
VDDQPEVREVITMMLEELGYTVSAVAGGVDMRQFLSANEPVDLVVLDRRMPGEDGMKLALHAKTLGMPVLMISADVQNIEPVERENLGNRAMGWDAQYMRLVMRFDIGAERYRWLNTSLFIAKGRLIRTGSVECEVFRLT